LEIQAEEACSGSIDEADSTEYPSQISSIPQARVAGHKEDTFRFDDVV
jgi:hypothetical protein